MDLLIFYYAVLNLKTRSSRSVLFQPRTGETVQCIQEESFDKMPFHHFIASSHQIAIVDERYSKRPLLSWAHQMNRDMPFGIKAIDMTEDEKSGGNPSIFQSISFFQISSPSKLTNFLLIFSRSSNAFNLESTGCRGYCISCFHGTKRAFISGKAGPAIGVIPYPFSIYQHDLAP